MNWQERAESAANYLTETDSLLADLKVQYERSKRRSKRTHAAIFLRLTGTVAERNAEADTSDEFVEAERSEMLALLAYEKLRNKRDTAETVIEFWRSWNKAKTEGQI